MEYADVEYANVFVGTHDESGPSPKTLSER